MFQRIQYAKSDSNAIAKVKGTYVERSGQSKVGAEADVKKQKRKTGKEKGNPLQTGLLPGMAPGAVVQNMVPNAIAPPAAGKILSHVFN